MIYSVGGEVVQKLLRKLNKVMNRLGGSAKNPQKSYFLKENRENLAKNGG